MKKGLISVMIANVICLVMNLLTNFLIPKYVSIETYSLIKTYTLYLTYAGFFSIGYNDGMYLKYGGKKLEEVNKKKLADNFLNYIILMIIMFIIVLIIGIVMKDMIILAFSVGMFAYNILGYLKSLYQATGKFDAYGKSLNIEKFAIFVSSMFLIFVLNSDNYIFFVWSQVLISLLVSIYLTIRLEKKIKFLKQGRFSIKEYTENIKSGFILMLGNFSSSIFTGLDRIFVKVLLTTTHFAMYSFATSMESFLNVFISPITISMYNYFCQKPPKEKIIQVKNISLIWGFFVISAAYPAKWILEHYLTEYIAANEIIFILFSAQVFYVVVKGIYINIYKAERKQNKYLKQMIFMTILAIGLNYGLFKIFHNVISIAVATLITSIIWLFVCELQSKEYRFRYKEYLAIIIIVGGYIFTGYMFNSILGCGIYYIISIITLVILMNDSLKYIIIFLNEYINKSIKKIKMKGR